MLQKNHQYTQAEELIEPIVEALENGEGKGSNDWVAFQFYVAKFYSEQHKYEESLNICKTILSTLEPKLDEEKTPYYYTVAVTLLKCFNKLGLTAEMVTDSVKIFQVLLKKYQEDQADTTESFLLQWTSTIFYEFRKVGYWNDLNRLAQQIQDEMLETRPLILEPLMEAQASALHQAGKTREAISRLEKYYSLIKGLGPDAEKAIHWCLSRIAKFYFYLDEFGLSRDRLLDLVAYADSHVAQLSLEPLIDLASSHLELGEEEAALKVLDRIRKVPPSKIPGNILCTRSKYLITCEARLGNRYDLNFKICRTPPARKEGEAEEDEADFKRKLDNFYLVCIFENPDPNGEPLLMETPVDHFDIDVKSPSVPTVMTASCWFLVKLILYKDSSKSERIGQHYQLVSYTPSFNSRPGLADSKRKQ